MNKKTLQRNVKSFNKAQGALLDERDIGNKALNGYESLGFTKEL